MRITVSNSTQEPQTTDGFVLRLIDSKDSKARIFLIMASIACMKDILKVKTPLTDKKEHFDAIADLFNDLDEEVTDTPILQTQLEMVFGELELVIEAELGSKKTDIQYHLTKAWRALVENEISLDVDAGVLESAVKLFQKLEMTKSKKSPSDEQQEEAF